MSDISSKIGGWVIAFLIGAGLGAFFMHRFDSDSPVTVTRTLIQKVPVRVPVPAAPSPEVAKVQTEQVAVKQIRVYKDEAKKKLNLPKDIQDAPQQKVVSASTVSPDEHPQTVTTVLDATTGESQVLVQDEPLPWIATDPHGELALDLVEKAGGPVARIQARQDLFQVKAVHFHVVAGADVPVPIMGMVGKPDAYVGVGVHYSW